MIFNKTILIGIGIVIGLYFLYKILFSKSEFEKDYERLYSKVLNSEEYKVKGQYEK
jgi:hypothetical protein